MTVYRRTDFILLILLLAAVMITLDSRNTTASTSPSISIPQTLQVKIDDKNVTFTIRGNVSVSQITEFSFINLPDHYNNTNIAFAIRNLSGSAAFMNLTIPKDMLLKNTEPCVTTNGVRPQDCGFSEDEKNFYVWFTALPDWEFKNDSMISIQFLLVYHHQPMAIASMPWSIWVIPFSIVIFAVIFISINFRRNHRKVLN